MTDIREVGARTGKAAMWATVEVFGFKVLRGRVSEQEVAGQTWLRVEALTVDRDSPDEQTDLWETYIYNPAAVFSIRPDTERNVRSEAPRTHRPDEEEPF